MSMAANTPPTGASKLMGMPVPPVHLIVGDEKKGLDDFLAERTRGAILKAINEELPGDTTVETTTLRSSEITVSEILEATSPSLFAEERAIIALTVDQAGKEATEVLLDAAKQLSPGMYLIIQHSGGGRNKSLLPKFRKVAEVHEAAPLKPSDRTGWVMNEFRAYGIRPTPDVVQALLESVGSDLRELASAVSQLVADAPGEITVETVRAYYTGVAEVSGFDIADLTVAGKTGQALASTRRALQLGIKPVVLASALATKVSGIARLYSTRRVDRSMAGTLGMAPWLMEKTHRSARMWSGEAVSQAVVIVAELDAAVKGQGGGDAEFAIEDAVRRISQLAG